MSDIFTSTPLTQEQIEKIIRAYYKNLNNAIDGFSYNVDIGGLKALRLVLSDAVDRIDQALAILDPK